MSVSEGAAMVNEGGRGEAGGAERLMEPKLLLGAMTNGKQISMPEMGPFSYRL